MGSAFWMGVRFGSLKTGQDQHTKQIESALSILTDHSRTILSNSQTVSALASDFTRFHSDYDGARYRDRLANVESAMRRELAPISQALNRVEAVLIATQQHAQPGAQH